MNIAEHIAYLIGDSKRVVIPNYPDTPTVPELLDKPDSEQGFDFIPKPEPAPDGDTGQAFPDGSGDPYQGVGDKPNKIGPGGLDNTIIIDDPGEDDEEIGGDPAPAMLVTSSEIPTVDYIKKEILEQWIQDSIVKISKLMPLNLKLHLTKSKSFTAGEWESELQDGIGYDLNKLESSDINGVMRYDGEIAYEARMIPFHQRSKARFGSGFLDECSETDPIYYINDMRLMVEPKPEDTHLDGLDGFCTIDYICYPKPDANDESLTDVPFDMHQIILIATAVRCKKYQIDSLELPNIPVLNKEFKGIRLDNPDTVDAIEKAQMLIDNYSTNSFKDFLETEDIEMAKTTLEGSASELQIASLELSEQDKAGSLYLAEFAQNISNFAQSISKFATSYKKLNADYDTLQAEYQELIYSLRGELPNKKQLKETERKLENIRQVVNRQ